jgi:hypothetical protein
VIWGGKRGRGKGHWILHDSSNKCSCSHIRSGYVPRNLYNSFYYYAVCILTHTRAHARTYLSPRSDAINFDTVKPAGLIFMWYETGRVYIVLFVFMIERVVTCLQCPRIIFSAFVLQVVAACPVCYAFPLVICRAVFQIAVVVWQLLRLRRIWRTRFFFFAFFLRRSASGIPWAYEFWLKLVGRTVAKIQGKRIYSKTIFGFPIPLCSYGTVSNYVAVW